MSLPLSIENQFDSEYNGLRAAKLPTAMQCNNLQLALKQAGVSFTIKIHKSKKLGRQFIIMLAEPNGQ